MVYISTCQCQRHRDAALIPGSGRSSGVENGNPLQCSFLENSMDRRAWWATVHGVAKESDTTEWLNTHTPTTNTLLKVGNCCITLIRTQLYCHTHCQGEWKWLSLFWVIMWTANNRDVLEHNTRKWILMDIICLLLMDISLFRRGYLGLLSFLSMSKLFPRSSSLVSSWAQLHQHKYPSCKGVKKAGFWHF